MRVLIVDDEAGIREVLRRWLEPAGFVVSDAQNATDALAIVAEQAIDIVLADLHMPGPGGLWLVEQVRTQYPKVAVILATADAEVPGSVSLQPGVVGYLVKPFTADSVRSAVANASAWRSAAQADSAEKPAVDPIDDWLNRAKGLRADKPNRSGDGG